MIILPELGFSNNDNRFINDVFPEPEGPTKAISSPDLIDKFTFLNNSILLLFVLKVLLIFKVFKIVLFIT